MPLATLRQIRTTDDPVVRGLLTAIMVSGAIMGLYFALSIFHFLNQPGPVAAYDPDPILIGHLVDDRHDVERNRADDGAIEVLASSDGGLSFLPIVLGYCSEDGSPVAESHRVFETIAPDGTISYFDAASVIPLDIVNGCKGPAPLAIPISPEVFLGALDNDLQVRAIFTVSAPDRETVVVSTEWTRIVSELDGPTETVAYTGASTP